MRKSSDFPDGPTKLGELIDKFMNEHDLNGTEFQARLHDAVSSYKPVDTKISKYVTTGRPVPTTSFLSAVAKVLQIPESEVRALATKPSSTTKRQKGNSEDSGVITNQQFKLLAGHTIWSAPVVLAAMQGLLNKFKVATYLEKSLDDNIASGSAANQNCEKVQPVYIDPETWSRSNCKPSISQRTPVPNQRRPLFPVEGNSNAPLLETLSAATACKLLEQRDDIDAIIVPGGIARARGLKRLACIADTRVGCLWLAPPKAREALEKYSSQFVCRSGSPGIIPEISTEWIARYLVDGGLRSYPKRFIALDSDTVAMSVLQSGFDVVVPGQSEAAMPYHASFETDKLVSASFTDIERSAPVWFQRDDSEFIGLITWSPQAHWVKSRSDRSSLTTFGLMSPLDAADRHLTFEICLNPRTARATSERQLLLAIGELVQAIAPICDGLNSQSAAGSNNANPAHPVRASHLAKLSNYFAISCDDSDPCDDTEIPEEYATPSQLSGIRKALAPINFDAAWRGAEIQNLLLSPRGD